MKDVNRRARRDSDVRNKLFYQNLVIPLFRLIKKASIETSDFIFNYSDSDSLGAELAEWYTYSEEPEFLWNVKAFKKTLYKENCKI